MIYHKHLREVPVEADLFCIIWREKGALDVLFLTIENS
jgi:hypothetical protein